MSLKLRQRTASLLRIHPGLAVALVVAGCAPATFVNPSPRPAAGAPDRVTQLVFDSTGVTSVTIADLPPPRPAPASAVRGCGPPGPGTPAKASPTDKIHPLLRRWIADSAGTTHVTVMVGYRDPFTLPRFPEPKTDEPRDSRFNRAAYARVDSIVSSIRAQRDSLYRIETSDLDKVYEGRVLEHYWITQAVLADVPLGRVKALAHRDDVVSITPDHSGEPPPSCTLPSQPARDDTPQSARDALKSDEWPGAAFADEWFCLLDTGVDSTHIAFKDPGNPALIHPRLSYLGDCVNGDAQCTGLPGVVSGSDIHPDGHGTSSAAIIVGFPQPNDCERGLLRGRIDCLKVYSTTLCPTGCSGVCLVHSAVLKALQLARYRLNTVTIAEMQAWGPPDGDISNAANQVFNTGGIVIAAQGNFDGCTSCASTLPCLVDCRVKSPANAHYVISAGGWDIKDLVLRPSPVPISMACGPTGDGRVKPDVLAPTATYVAGDHSDTHLHPFGGTSGAAPYVAGAAALIHHVLSPSLPPADKGPGMTYVFLILAGRDTWTQQATGTSQSTFDATRGAGPLELPDLAAPTAMVLRAGRMSLLPGMLQTVPFDLTGRSVGRVEAALWWADPRQPGILTYGHSQIDLELARVGQPAAASSRHPTSVFQRATALVGAGERTMWNLNITGTMIPSWAIQQEVYFVVIGR